MLTDSIQPFLPGPNTVALAVTTATANITPPTLSSNGDLQGNVQAVLYNNSSYATFVVWGKNTGLTAALPAVGSAVGAPGVMLAPQSTQTFTVPDGCTFAAIGEGSGTLYVTLGRGF